MEQSKEDASRYKYGGEQAGGFSVTLIPCDLGCGECWGEKISRRGRRTEGKESREKEVKKREKRAEQDFDYQGTGRTELKVVLGRHSSVFYQDARKM